MEFSLPPLPFGKDRLQLNISPLTVELHYERHHAGYLKALNDLLAKDDIENSPLEALIQDVAGDDDRVEIFRNAGQVWNHAFYWKCLKPVGGLEADGGLAEAITQAFGSVKAFREAFIDAATSRFGSGWAWLARTSDRHLEVCSTPDADPVFTRNLFPILTCDVWEHAYYLDFQNERERYVETFLDKLLNWEFVNDMFEREDEELTNLYAGWCREDA